MSEQRSDDNGNLLNFIAATVETMREQMATMREQMATMREQMVTKDDLASLREQMATKDDLSSVRDEVAYLGGQVETMRNQMATKSDIARLSDKLEVETTAIRGDIEQVHLRLDSIERALTSRLGHIEAEMSRLRSVVYLLVKDKPEMLRLLGQSPPTQ